VFKAETLRGILLTSFGFSQLGEKGAEAATAAYSGAGLMGLLSIVGLVVARRTPRTDAWAVAGRGVRMEVQPSQARSTPVT